MITWLKLHIAEIKIAGMLVLAAALFYAGWTAQGWRKDAVIADLKRERAENSATQSKAELGDLIDAGKTIHAAALEFGGIQNTLGVKIDGIQRELKNVQKNTPLPADCKPDADRLRLLKAAVDAANEAATR